MHRFNEMQSTKRKCCATFSLLATFQIAALCRRNLQCLHSISRQLQAKLTRIQSTGHQHTAEA